VFLKSWANEMFESEGEIGAGSKGFEEKEPVMNPLCTMMLMD